MLEEKLELIAAALERIANHLDEVTFVKTVNPIVKEISEPNNSDSIPPMGTEWEASLGAKPAKAPAPPPPKKKKKPMTAEEFDAALIIEFERLGNDDTKILACMEFHGAKSIPDLDASKYSLVLDAVRAL